MSFSYPEDKDELPKDISSFIRIKSETFKNYMLCMWKEDDSMIVPFSLPVMLS